VFGAVCGVVSASCSFSTRVATDAFAELREQSSVEAALLPAIGGLTTGVLALGYPEILYQVRWLGGWAGWLAWLAGWLAGCCTFGGLPWMPGSVAVLPGDVWDLLPAASPPHVLMLCSCPLPTVRAAPLLCSFPLPAGF
jgi:hypothetical protein